MIRRIPRDSAEAAAARPLELSVALERLRGTLDEARREQQLRARLAPQLARALRALLAEELALCPEHIAALVERELARVRQARFIELHVHPEDAPLLSPLQQLRDRLELAGELRVVEDARLERGGCVLITNLGEIDAKLETRLELGLAQLESGVFDEP